MNQVSSERIGLRPREAAAAIGVSTRTLYTLTKRGVIPHVKLARAVLYPRDLLQQWLRQQALATTGHGGAADGQRHKT